MAEVMTETSGGTEARAFTTKFGILLDQFLASPQTPSILALRLLNEPIEKLAPSLFKVIPGLKELELKLAEIGNHESQSSDGNEINSDSGTVESSPTEWTSVSLDRRRRAPLPVVDCPELEQLLQDYEHDGREAVFGAIKTPWPQAGDVDDYVDDLPLLHDWISIMRTNNWPTVGQVQELWSFALGRLKLELGVLFLKREVFASNIAAPVLRLFIHEQVNRTFGPGAAEESSPSIVTDAYGGLSTRSQAMTLVRQLLGDGRSLNTCFDPDDAVFAEAFLSERERRLRVVPSQVNAYAAIQFLLAEDEDGRPDPALALFNLGLYAAEVMGGGTLDTLKAKIIDRLDSVERTIGVRPTAATLGEFFLIPLETYRPIVMAAFSPYLEKLEYRYGQLFLDYSLQRVGYCLCDIGERHITLKALRNSSLPSIISMMDQVEHFDSLRTFFSTQAYRMMRWQARDQIDEYPTSEVGAHGCGVSMTTYGQYGNGGIPHETLHRLPLLALGPIREAHLSFEQFVQISWLLDDKSQHRVMQVWFDLMDLDRDGVLTYSEVDVFWSAHITDPEGLSELNDPLVVYLSHMADVAGSAGKEFYLPDLLRMGDIAEEKVDYLVNRVRWEYYHPWDQYHMLETAEQMPYGTRFERFLSYLETPDEGPINQYY